MSPQPPPHQLGDFGPRCVGCGEIFPCNTFRAQARAATEAAEAREKAEQIRRTRGKAA